MAAEKKVSLIHPNYVNRALEFGEVEGIEAKEREDGSMYVDMGELTCEQAVDRLVNGVMLAYTKGWVNESNARGGD